MMRKYNWSRYLHRLIGFEISSLSRYYDRLIQWRSREEDTGYLLDQIDCEKKEKIADLESFPDLSGEKNQRTIVLLNGNQNFHFDIQELLSGLKAKLSRTSRVVLVGYNPYLRGVYWLANAMGFRKGPLPVTLVTKTDLHNIVKLSGFEVVKTRPVGYVPWHLFGLGSFLNRIIPVVPFLNLFCLAHVTVLRPLISEKESRPLLSIVIPARNERGNIENALIRLEAFDGEKEVIFVEGHSNDETWEEILRVQKKYEDRYRIVACQQTGKGKGDAVRLGFQKASGDLLTILDADLTMPPELLNRFYNAFCEGQADFVNGTRLVYPMEGEAMRFLNLLGNVFFAKALSWVLGVRLADSLCGTKLFARHDYARMQAWRADFGDFDPFGDFEMLFPAAILGLGVVDVPIRYRARTYGTTNISRFRHGLMLLKMTVIGFGRVKLGRVR
jgi:hypothetical protein